MAATTVTGIEAIAETYWAAWAACDPDAIAALHAEDTVFWLHAGGEPVRGRQAVRDEFARIFETFPAFSFETYRTFFGADHWVLDWALISEVPGEGGTARPIRFDLLDVVTVSPEGLVVRKDTFLDGAQFAAALEG